MTDQPCIEYFNMGPWPVFVGFTASKKKFRKEMNRLKFDSEFVSRKNAAATAHMFTCAGVLTYIITMDLSSKPSVEQIAALLAHEAVHIVQDMNTELGEKSPGKEAEAYLVQYIMQMCLQVALKSPRERRGNP